ncbi:hypothetical protein HMPREF0388_0870 [Mobiluncus curtisii ATCC 51333]|uniref:Uncharacterized protein n=1 Tax=Mobiluncus curtisii ATCC 51333 TaxID=887326 RepID=E6LYD3_9ACTO|nr:hypothetical protein HMPREF0388_0870 [Mobiluncus curtisii ATCC 51333]
MKNTVIQLLLTIAVAIIIITVAIPPVWKMIAGGCILAIGVIELVQILQRKD